MARPKAKYKVNDVVMHKEQKKVMIITGKDYMNGADHTGNKDCWLYTMKVVNPGEGPEYKRYYEHKITDNCSKVKNSKAVKVLYGKKSG
jgi:hypothetical protein